MKDVQTTRGRMFQNDWPAPCAYSHVEDDGAPFGKYGGTQRLSRISLEDLGVDVAPRLKTLKVAEPQKRSAGAKLPGVKTLVGKQKTQAKVL